MAATIALVDDDRNILASVSIAMQAEGYITRLYTDGDSALKALLDNPPDLAILDVKMPQMDGHNLCKRIKDDPVLKRLPVLLFSSLITDKLLHKGESVGADEQISKPQVTALAQKALALIKERGFGVQSGDPKA